MAGRGDRLCVNCAHHGRTFDGYGISDECQRPLTTEIDPVNGHITHRVWKSCASERRNDRTLFGRARCGRDGQFFEAAK